MSYLRFGLMIVTSTVVMFVLMYLNTYAWEHVFFSETRVYMAILMGATMAVIMLAFMLGMYSNTRLNIAIFAGAVIVFALSLWLVRSQATVSGLSYMRAMIPHHSIAILTSERAQIRDARVRKLADGIIAAQRREIAEMRYLIGEVDAGRSVSTIYEDPPATPGTVDQALSNTLVSELDLAPMPRDEADRVLQAQDVCTFNRSPESDPILWAARDGSAAAMKLNGVLIGLDGATAATPGPATAFAAPGAAVTVTPLGRRRRLAIRCGPGLSDRPGADHRLSRVFRLPGVTDEGSRHGTRGDCGADPRLVTAGPKSYITPRFAGGAGVAMEAHDIEELIRTAFPDATVTITDLAGDGNHFAAEVVDESFRGKNRVQQQRAVYAALQGRMDGPNGALHALALTTKAPD